MLKLKHTPMKRSKYLLTTNQIKDRYLRTIKHSQILIRKVVKQPHVMNKYFLKYSASAYKRSSISLMIRKMRFKAMVR